MATVSYTLGGLLGLLMVYLFYAGLLNPAGLIGMPLTYFFMCATADILYVMIPRYPNVIKAAAVDTATSLGRLGGTIDVFVTPYIIVTFEPLSYAALITPLTDGRDNGHRHHSRSTNGC